MILRQPLATLTRLTLKYTTAPAGLLFLTPDDMPDAALLYAWLKDAQEGMDAFFDDHFDLAHAQFEHQAAESPFHALGYAMIAYAEAMVSFDVPHIQTAQERLASAEALCHLYAKRLRRRQQHASASSRHAFRHHHASNRNTNSNTASADDSPSSSSSSSLPPSPTQSSLLDGDANAYELLQANCALMSATLQFLSNRWVDYMRGAYKLRKTYKKYEQLFEWITGESTADYPHLARRRKRAKTSIRKKKHAPPAATCSSSTSSSSSQPSTQHHPRSFPSPWSVKGGIFFGLGLLILIFSLLPPKLAKLLNTFGFYASRPFALQLLQEAYHLNDEFYSPLSAMALLAYYTSLSSFIHPQLLPSSFNLAKARAVVDATKAKFPQGKIWKLLEGKLCRMEGDLAKSVQVLRDCRRRNSVCTSVWQLNQKYQKQYDALIAKGANKDALSPCLQQFQSLVVSELSLQISALSVYEMGWGQIFLGDYFQASETFFRLESMNNWSRAFYHYIATCCLYGDEEYDKAALDFMQIPKLLARRRRHGSRLMPNEQFADHVIRQWLVQAATSSATATATVAPMTGRKPSSSSSSLALTGASLQKVALVHPLWELIYVWHGLYHVSPSMLATMQVELQKTLDTLGKWSTAYCSERARLYLLLGVVQRECGDDDHAETCFKRVLMLKKVCHLHHRHNDHPIQPPVSQQDQQHQPMHESASSANASTLMGAVSWAGPYALYELALLKALQLEKVSSIEKKRHIAREAKDYLHKIDSPHGLDAISHDEWMAKDISYEAAYMLLHVRCQLLAEKLDELVDA